ncbi:hypothetical protein J8I87_10580 [Paraburkholderia sp. LEh10]|uniref:hypothetical protein n=1 Tax=Paraburkholderia sp. LEh10 TaxID=2821353 RepID=UPI001AE3BCAE|nr:hypothetical protein [Paraburkholderia sp. LEh10]MBP0590156.1 hypothetical protein [Paraburkholderia sp. LEh10]
MAIEFKVSNYALVERATYVTVDGARHAIVRADAWFDPLETANAPAPGGKSLSVAPGSVIKDRGKFYGARTVKLSPHPNQPACRVAVHRAIYYPADQVTLTAVTRKKHRPSSSAHRKSRRGKVGVGGMRTGSHG